jgi:hypothetical protein
MTECSASHFPPTFCLLLYSLVSYHIFQNVSFSCVYSRSDRVEPLRSSALCLPTARRRMEPVRGKVAEIVRKGKSWGVTHHPFGSYCGW